MAVRSVKLRLLISTDENGRDVRKALWNTHALTNQGIGYYLEKLILMRQDIIEQIEGSSLFSDINPCTRETCQQMVETIVQQVLEKKKQAPATTYESQEILQLIRSLYERIIPASVGTEGDTRDIVKKFLPALVDPDLDFYRGKNTRGEFLVNFSTDVLEARPPEDFVRPRASSKKEYEKAKSEGTLEDWKARQIQELQGPIAQLAKRGVLPLFEPYSSLHPWKKSKPLTPRDRDMFQQAVEKMNAWETWNQRVKINHQRIRKARDSFAARFGIDNTQNPPDWFAILRFYEDVRNQDQQTLAMSETSGFTITSAVIRGWHNLHQAWISIPEENRTEDALWDCLDKVVAERGGSEIPEESRRLYVALIAPTCRIVWENKDYLTIFARYNQLETWLERTPDCAVLKFADVRLNPHWARFEARGGTSLKNYEVCTERTGLYSLMLPLLFVREDGSIKDEITNLSVVPTDKWGNFTVFPYRMEHKEIDEKPGQRVEYMDPGTGYRFEGTTFEGKLNFNGNYIKWFKEDFLAQGEVGPVWFKLVLDLDSMKGNDGSTGPVTWPLARTLKRHYDQVARRDVVDGYWTAREALGSSAGIEEINLKPAAGIGVESLREGARVMTIELGTRSLAACSVFEVRRELAHPEKLHFPIAGTNHYAVHLRSFFLYLPGENAPVYIEQMRDAVCQERMELEEAFRTVLRLRALGDENNPEKRRTKLLAVLEGLHADQPMEGEQAQPVNKILNPSLLLFLKDAVDKDEVSWKFRFLEVHRQWEAALEAAFLHWKQQGKFNPYKDYFHNVAQKPTRLGRPPIIEKQGLGGLSIWHLQELTDMWELMKSMNFYFLKAGRLRKSRLKLGHKKDQITREEEKERRLKERIDDLMEERAKQAAEHVLMAALGYVFEKGPGNLSGEWVARFPACHLILFEDNSRFKIRSDRPEGERTDIMLWMHKEIQRLSAVFCEPFGISLGEVPADFLSRYFAPTGAPGVRGKRVTAEDLANYRFVMALQQELGHERVEPLDDKMILLRLPNKKLILKEGDVVPYTTGNIFISLNRSDRSRPDAIDAGINVAQNLMGRFWSSDAGPLRIAARPHTVEGKEVFIPVTFSDGEKPSAGHLEPVEGGAYRWRPAKVESPEPQANRITICSMCSEILPPNGNSDSLNGEAQEKKNLVLCPMCLSENFPPEETDENNDEEILAFDEQTRGETVDDREELIGCTVFFRDPSGIVFPEHLWYPASQFWSGVKTKVMTALYREK